MKLYERARVAAFTELRLIRLQFVCEEFLGEPASVVGVGIATETAKELVKLLSNAIEAQENLQPKKSTALADKQPVRGCDVGVH